MRLNVSILSIHHSKRGASSKRPQLRPRALAMHTGVLCYRNRSEPEDPVAPARFVLSMHALTAAHECKSSTMAEVAGPFVARPNSEPTSTAARALHSVDFVYYNVKTALRFSSRQMFRAFQKRVPKCHSFTSTSSAQAAGSRPGDPRALRPARAQRPIPVDQRQEILRRPNTEGSIQRNVARPLQGGLGCHRY